MWENETIVLVTSLKKRLLGGESSVRFKQISKDDALPGFVKKIFQNRVEGFIRDEKPLQIQKTTHFDIQPQDLEHLKAEISEVLREAAIFQNNEVEDVLRQALVFRLNYLVKPVDTMRRVLFENREDISLKEMEELFSSFKQALPYAEHLIKECTRQGKAIIEREEYGRVVNEICKDIIDGDPQKALKVVLKDFSVLTDFLSETKGESVIQIEGSVIQEFLADRTLWGFRRALDVEMKLGKETFSSPELEMTIKRYLQLKEEFAEEKEQVDFSEAVVNEREQETKEEKKSEEKSDEEIVIPELEEKEVKTPEKKKVQEKEVESWNIEEDFLDKKISIQQAKEDAEKREKEEKEEEKSKPKTMRIIRREQKNDVEEIESLGGDGSKEETFVSEEEIEKKGLRTFIDAKLEKGFVKKLFDGESEAYEHLLDKLDEAENWRVAKILIDNELFKRDVDPFSREAIKLVDLVYSLYYPDEGVGGKK